MWRYHGYLRKSAYEEGEGEPTVLLDSAAARLVKMNLVHTHSISGKAIIDMINNSLSIPLEGSLATS